MLQELPLTYRWALRYIIYAKFTVIKLIVHTAPVGKGNLIFSQNLVLQSFKEGFPDIWGPPRTF